MGTSRYLVNHPKRQIFELGKALSAYDFVEARTEEQLVEDLMHRFTTGPFASRDFRAWAKQIAPDVMSTVGLNFSIGYS